MISKVFLLFFVLEQLTLIHSDEDIYSMPQLQPIRDEIFAAMTAYTQNTWDQTAIDNQNFHLFPVLVKMRHYCVLLKLFHEKHLNEYYPQDKFLEKPYAFSKILTEMKFSSTNFMRTPNAILYDRRNISEGYLKDLMKYYRTEPITISFDPRNERWVLWEINRWLDLITNGHYPKKESLSIKGMASYHSILLTFRGCWETTKTFITRAKMNPHPRRRRFIPPVPSFPTISKLTLELLDDYEVDSFSAQDTIAYYNNVKQKYEAIKIPFTDEEFAMIVMVPYSNYSLEIFRNFTGADYLKLFHEVNRTENYENVHFKIPVIKSGMFFVNEKGVGMSVKDFGGCPAPPEPYDRSRIYHRLFSVNRSFSVVVYHIKTQFVLLNALVRNASSEVWPPPKYRIQLGINGENEAFQHIS